MVAWPSGRSRFRGYIDEFQLLVFRWWFGNHFLIFWTFYSGDIHMSSPLHQLLYLSIIEGISWWDYHDHGRTRMKQQQWVTSIEFGQFQSWRSMQDSIGAWVDVGGIFLGRTAEVYVERKVIVQFSETTKMKWMELNSGWSQSRGALTLVGPNSPTPWWKMKWHCDTHGVNPWKPVASHTVLILLEEGLLCDQVPWVYITQWLSGLVWVCSPLVWSSICDTPALHHWWNVIYSLYKYKSSEYEYYSIWLYIH